MCDGFDVIRFYMFSFLAKRGVKEEIMSFNARKISPEIRDSVQELLDKNKKSFDPVVRPHIPTYVHSAHAYMHMYVKKLVCLTTIVILSSYHNS